MKSAIGVVLLLVVTARASVSQNADADPRRIAAMKSDLRNLVPAEEAYFADSVKYTADPQVLARLLTLSPGVTGLRVTLTADGWTASVGHLSTSTFCVIYVGTTRIAPATKEGDPTCQTGGRPPDLGPRPRLSPQETAQQVQRIDQAAAVIDGIVKAVQPEALGDAEDNTFFMIYRVGTGIPKIVSSWGRQVVNRDVHFYYGEHAHLQLAAAVISVDGRETRKDRYYFLSGRMIQWVDSAGRVILPGRDTARFEELESQVLQESARGRAIVGQPGEKPDLPVQIGFRRSLVGEGLVAQFKSLSDKALSVTARFSNQATQESRVFRLELSARGMKEFGRLEGWVFGSGHTIEVSADGYEALKATVP